MSVATECVYVVQQKWPTESDDKWRDRKGEEFATLAGAMERRKQLEGWYAKKAYLHSDGLAFVFRVGKRPVPVLQGAVAGGAG